MSHCMDCGDEFHLDDAGGYNPPCQCGCGLCRRCHDAAEREDAGYEDDVEPCEKCGELDWVSPCYACRVTIENDNPEKP